MSEARLGVLPKRPISLMDARTTGSGQKARVEDDDDDCAYETSNRISLLTHSQWSTWRVLSKILSLRLCDALLHVLCLYYRPDAVVLCSRYMLALCDK